ncbi:Fc.00g061160.m01.CDS01 [Cosmosporella sp. VM-42]
MGSRDIAIQPEGKVRFWYRDNFFVTNDKSYLDPQVFNKSLDDLWWSSPLQSSQLQKVLSHCLTIGVYWVPQSEAEMKKNGISRPSDGSPIKMVGFARVVTDYVTFAYLTDVFILDDYQRRGLASWLMRALKEIVDEWPDMRGLLLMTHDHAAARLYKRELGAVEFDKGPSAGLVVLEMPGPAEKPTPTKHP